MASVDLKVEEIYFKLASIPENLQGTTWLAISELALVVCLPGAILSSALKRLRSDNPRWQAATIETTKFQPASKEKCLDHILLAVL